MKQKITIILAGVATVFAVVCGITMLSSDSEAPVIKVPEGETTYKEGNDTGILLESVTAEDNKDGNISDKIRIAEISVLEDGKRAVVTYAVYDEANNLGKATRIIGYEPAVNEIAPGDSTPPEETTEEANNTTETNTNDTKEPEEPEEPEDTEEPEEPEEPKPGYEDPEMVSNGNPVVKLNTHEVRIPVGGSFNSMNYVEDVIDLEDERTDLYRRLFLEGEYDRFTAGEYELTYYCIDSDGNRSNEAKLMLIVENE